MPYLRDRVIVLKREPFREQDRRYVMYGREHGLLSAVARGASLPRSKQAGHLEPFSEADVMIAKGAAFDKLAVAKLVARGSLFAATSLSSYAIAGAFFDLLIRLSRPGISDERIFDLVKELIVCVAEMPGEPSADRARLLNAAATLRLLDLLGFGPPIEMDQRGEVTSPLRPLLQFMRQSSFADVLRVTASRDILQDASAFVEDSLKHAPLNEEPHGPKTILAYLG